MDPKGNHQCPYKREAGTCKGEEDSVSGERFEESAPLALKMGKEYIRYRKYIYMGCNIL